MTTFHADPLYGVFEVLQVINLSFFVSRMLAIQINQEENVLWQPPALATLVWTISFLVAAAMQVVFSFDYTEVPKSQA